MWTVRSSDGIDTLHTLYPKWAKDVEGFTVIELVPKIIADDLRAELKELREVLQQTQHLAKNQKRNMRHNSERVRNIEGILLAKESEIQRLQAKLVQYQPNSALISA